MCTAMFCECNSLLFVRELRCSDHWPNLKYNEYMLFFADGCHIRNRYPTTTFSVRLFLTKMTSCNIEHCLYKKVRISLHRNSASELRGVTYIILYHTVLPATRHKWTHPRLTIASKLILVVSASLSSLTTTTTTTTTTTMSLVIFRDSRKSRQKMVKNTADFCENGKYHGKITSKTRHQITGPKTIIQSIKVNILASTTIITCSARFSSAKFCHCGALTNSRNTF